MHGDITRVQYRARAANTVELGKSPAIAADMEEKTILHSVIDVPINLRVAPRRTFTDTIHAIVRTIVWYVCLLVIQCTIERR